MAETLADEMYADRANEYAAKDERMWRQPSGTALALQALCDELQPRRVLELGVGTGRYFPFLRGEIYFGVDACDPMLACARRRESILRERGFRTVTLAQREIRLFLAEPGAISAFDLVVAIGCLGYLLPVNVDLLAGIRNNLMSANGWLLLQTTQMSAQLRMRFELRRAISFLRGGRETKLYVTNPRRLRVVAQSAGLHTEWIRADAARFHDRPLLLSLYRRLPCACS